MYPVLTFLIKWSEVWALLIPIPFILKYRYPAYLKPVVWYIILALVINIAADIIMMINKVHPEWGYSNNVLYNVHSIVRYVCFTAFLFKLQPGSKINKVVSVLTILWLLINFIFLENFFDPKHISSRLYATESGVLLFYCMQYYLYNLQAEQSGKRKADFWVVTGLSIYMVFNFPFFLLYTTLIENYVKLLIMLWDFHNITYIVLCIFIARAFYISRNE